jgi:hypothetical protein
MALVTTANPSLRSCLLSPECFHSRYASTFLPILLLTCATRWRRSPSLSCLAEASPLSVSRFQRLRLASASESSHRGCGGPYSPLLYAPSAPEANRLRLRSSLLLIPRYPLLTKWPGRGQAKNIALSLSLRLSLCPRTLHPFYLSSTCSHSSLCGDEGTRTPGLRLAKAALSQLSYIPSRRPRSAISSTPSPA